MSLAQVSCLVITDLSLFLLHAGKEMEALKGEVAWVKPSCLEMSMRSKTGAQTGEAVPLKLGADARTFNSSPVFVSA